MKAIKKASLLVICLLLSASATADMLGYMANIVGVVAPQYRQQMQYVQMAAPVLQQAQQPQYQPQQAVYQQQYQQQESRYENYNGGYDPN